jgi:hypothetical protein
LTFTSGILHSAFYVQVEMRRNLFIRLLPAEKPGEQNLLQRNQELRVLYRQHQPYHEATRKACPGRAVNYASGW